MKDQLLMSSEELDRKVRKLSSEILDDSGGAKNLVLIGIRSTGAHFAKYIARHINKAASTEVPVGLLDISLYRDDFFNRPIQPSIKKTVLNFDITGKHIVLVDDVLWTGRTVRAALDHMIDFGRPDKVRLCVLIDRGGREFPIQPDFKGKTVHLPSDSWVNLSMSEEGGKNEVLITARKPQSEEK